MNEVRAIVEESAKSFATWYHPPILAYFPFTLNCQKLIGRRETYLGYPSNILIAILLRESQILVQSKSHVIAIQSV